MKENNRKDLAEIINTYLPINKFSRNYSYVCPSHSDDNDIPNMIISP